MRKSMRRVIVAILLLAILCAAAVHFYSVSIFASDGYYYSIDTATTASVYGRYVDDPNVKIEREFSDHFITEIVSNAFAEDENMVTLDLSEAELLEKIGNYAFLNCSNLSGELLLYGRFSLLGMSAFQGCSSLESLRIITNQLSLIPEQCFYNCTSLSSVELSNSITRIDKLAFGNCSSLMEITIPATVTSIDNSAFNGCDDLTIYCYYDSYAVQFAEDNGIPYVIVNPPTPTEPTEEPTEAPTEEPTQEPTEEPTESGSYVLGDVDNNGLVETIDSTWIQRYNVLMDLPDTLTIPHGDVDGDGDVSLIDSTYILRYCTQMEVPYPIGEWVEES